MPQAACTNPLSRLACSARCVRNSACHWTPSVKRADGSHSASTVPSGARAATSSPAPMRSAAWWWKEFTARPSLSVSQCSSEPRATSASWAGENISCVWRWPGTCWCSVPPRETLSACRPRQMPSSGRSRSAAPQQQRLLVLVGDEVDVGAEQRMRAPGRRARGRGPGRRSPAGRRRGRAARRCRRRSRGRGARPRSRPPPAAPACRRGAAPAAPARGRARSGRAAAPTPARAPPGARASPRRSAAGRRCGGGGAASSRQDAARGAPPPWGPPRVRRVAIREPRGRFSPRPCGRLPPCSASACSAA